MTKNEIKNFIYSLNNYDNDSKINIKFFLNNFFSLQITENENYIDNLLNEVETEFLNIKNKNNISLKELKNALKNNKILIDKTIIQKSLKIIHYNKIPYTYFNENIDKSLEFIENYKKYLIKKSFYSLIYNLNKIGFIDKKKSIEDLFININKNTGFEFFKKEENVFNFNINNSKNPLFVISNNDKLYGIDIYIENDIDYYYFKKFINLHLKFYNKNIENLKLSEFKKLINNKIIYILCFENEPEYDKITFEDTILLNIISTLKFNNKNFEKIYFENLIKNLNYNTKNVNIKKEYWITTIVKSYLEKNIEEYLKSLYPNNNFTFNRIKSNINHSINNLKNNEEIDLFLKEIGINDKKNIEIVRDILILKNNNINKKEIDIKNTQTINKNKIK